MMGYKDRTWCCSAGCKNECGRKLTPQDHEAAIKWWGNEDYPVVLAEFCKEGKQ